MDSTPEHRNVVSLTVEIPLSVNLGSKELKEYLAAKLFGDGTISLGQMAAMLGKTKWDIPEILSRYGVPYFNYDAEDFRKEFRFGQ
jgi:predicted HTH domain antitoxin